MKYFYGFILGVVLTCFGAFFWSEKQSEYFAKEEERRVDSIRAIYQAEITYLSKEIDSIYQLKQKHDTILITLKANEKAHISVVDSMPSDSLIRAIRFSLLHD